MTKFIVRYLSPSEYDDWDAFVGQSQYGTLFHKSTWASALHLGSEHAHFKVVGCFNKDNNLVGGTVISWKKILWKLKATVVPYATPFFGIVVNERNSEYVSKLESYRFGLIEALLDFIEKEYDIVTMIMPPEFEDLRIFNWRNYDVQVMYTYRGQINHPEKLVFLPDIRRRIKKAEQLEYKILTNKEDEHLDQVFHLLKKSYARQVHAFRFTHAQFTELLKNPLVSDQIKNYTIWYQDVPVAAIVVLVDGKKGYYWLAGGDHTYFDTGLNQLLLSKVIDELSTSGIELLDLVGANTHSISNYKSGYNFNLENYYFVSKNTRRFARFLFLMKDLAGIFKRN